MSTESLKQDHETMKTRKKELSDNIRTAMKKFEEDSGVYVTSINYFKNLQMEQLDIRVDLKVGMT